MLTLSRSKFPFFLRWIKVLAIDDPYFVAAVEAKNLMCNFLALHAGNVLPPPKFMAENFVCIRPSATMLTSLATVPDATPVEFPPLDENDVFEAAVRAGHGRYVYSSDNEVFYFKDELTPDG